VVYTVDETRKRVIGKRGTKVASTSTVTSFFSFLHTILFLEN
jgi:hypothetical protein